ncbi:thiol-disulfide isomerase/thioredoxin [Sphaerotilus sulfidivorans]|uniref:Thiol-disulfide isomerase/thioredoxin n=2 Tax=Sphaerotilus sulfidivorans TaxID=639200 RepID=A0ABV2IQ51_9BURK|nr:thioredoxin family protein [Sphaerotilus sulfidivorans]
MYPAHGRLAGLQPQLQALFASIPSDGYRRDALWPCRPLWQTAAMTPAEPIPASSATAAISVVCLCAGWCTTCQAYGTTFAQLARDWPQVRFAWIDIEEHSDALGDAALDIENFPTVMVLRGARPLFFGTILPHAGTLARLVQSAVEGGATQAVDADGQALAAPVAALLAQGVGGVGTGAAA